MKSPNCPKCNKLMRMYVPLGISCPGEFQGKITNQVFERKDVQIEYVQWNLARYVCSNCHYDSGLIVTDISSLTARIEELENELEKLKEDILPK